MSNIAPPPVRTPMFERDGVTMTRAWQIYFQNLTSKVGVTAGGTTNQVYGEVPGGPVDGVNASFTLANIPVPSKSLQLFKNGVKMLLGTAYTFAGKKITYLAGYIPQPGQGGQPADVHEVNYTF